MVDDITFCGILLDSKHQRPNGQTYGIQTRVLAVQNANLFYLFLYEAVQHSEFLIDLVSFLIF